jgi:hypothetical protein
MSSNSASNHACNTTFGHLVTPLTRTWPVAGWNNVSILAVPCERVHVGNEQADRRAANGCRAEEELGMRSSSIPRSARSQPG